MMWSAATTSGPKGSVVSMGVPSGAKVVATTLEPVLIWRTSPGAMFVTVPASWKVVGTDSVSGGGVQTTWDAVTVDAVGLTVAGSTL